MSAKKWQSLIFGQNSILDHFGQKRSKNGPHSTFLPVSRNCVITFGWNLWQNVLHMGINDTAPFVSLEKTFWGFLHEKPSRPIRSLDFKIAISLQSSVRFCCFFCSESHCHDFKWWVGQFFTKFKFVPVTPSYGQSDRSILWTVGPIFLIFCIELQLYYL